MNQLFTIIMYILWIISLIGLLVITFTNFQYLDLNVIVVILFALTLINSFFTLRRK